MKHAWSYHIELPSGPDGMRRQEKASGFATGKDAAEARAEVIQRHRQGTLPKNTSVTVAEWLRTWLIAQEQIRGLREGTIVDYRRHVELYWIPYLGAVRLVDLRPRHVSDTLAAIRRLRDKDISRAEAINAKYQAEADAERARRKAAGQTRRVRPKRVAVPRPFSPATAKLVHATLRAALNAAVRAEEIPRNVAVFAERPRVIRTKVRPWEPEQLGAWLDHIAEHRLYASTTLRRSPDYGAVSCADSAGTTSISTGHASSCGGRSPASPTVGQPPPPDAENAPCTGPGPRPPMGKPESLTSTRSPSPLRAWRKHQIAERLAWGQGWANHDNLVFTRQDGAPLDPNTPYNTFVALVREAGLPQVPLHHLRHGSASLQLAAGVDIAIVSKRLGHSKIDLTSNTYGHLIGNAGKQAAEAAAAIVPRQGRVGQHHRSLGA